jgi:hypothetical protein
LLSKDEARRIAQITKAISIADIKMIVKATKAISASSTLRMLSPIRHVLADDLRAVP